jgi:acyl carrier protein
MRECRVVPMKQKVVDGIARTFYSLLAVAGLLSSIGFVALGVYGAASENILKNRLFFAAMAVVGAAVGNTSLRFLKYVRSHDDLPTDDMGIVEIVLAVEKAFDTQVPDAEAERMSTPRELIDWLLPRLEGKPLSIIATRVLSKHSGDSVSSVSAAQVWTREMVSKVVMMIIAEQIRNRTITEDSRFIGDIFA